MMTGDNDGAPLSGWFRYNGYDTFFQLLPNSSISRHISPRHLTWGFQGSSGLNNRVPQLARTTGICVSMTTVVDPLSRHL